MFDTYSEFWTFILNKYDEEKQLTIENLISYYINKYNGYGHYNCEISYQECINFDTTGELNRLALIGVEFEKQFLDKLITRVSKK